MDDEPAWAFGNEGAQKQNAEGKDRTDKEGRPPAEFRIDVVRIKQDDRRKCARRAAEPERAIDGEVGVAAHASRDEFLDRRIDRTIFAADPRPGQQTKDAETRQIEGESGRRRRKSVERERDEEKLLAAEPVRQPAEDQCAGDRADEIEA